MADPSTMVPHVIRQGEFLTQLAHKLRFDAREVWNHAKNAGLRNRRPNPEMLAPGDILFVPVVPPKRVPFRSGGTQRYTTEVPTLRIHLKMQAGTEPLADEVCMVEGLQPEATPERTGTDGCLSLDVPIHVRQFRVVFFRRRLVLPVQVGHLDPPDEYSGVRQRLEHLGYYGPPALVTGEASGLHRNSMAVARFQAALGHAPTGHLDDETREALVKVHGG